jgi:hypothetical protein
MDEIFGNSSEPETRKPPRMMVPQRCLNSIEATLLGQISWDQNSWVPPPFIDGETGDIESADYEGMTLRTALDLRNMILLEAEEKFRRQIIIARELGPLRIDGGPFTSEYELACAAEGVVPWPVGDPLRIERK